MLDFLNQTTYDNDPLYNGEFQSQIMQQLYERDMQEQMAAAQSEDSQPGEGLHSGIDSDLIDLINNNADKLYDVLREPDEKVDDDNRVNPNQFDFTNDVINSDDSSVYGLLFGDDDEAPRQSTGSATQASGLDWLKKKTDQVNLNGINPNISKYLSSLPDDIKNELVATSGDDGDEHVEGSQHYQGNAVDLRWNPQAWNYIQKDPNFGTSGLKTINPDHGTAKHIHIQTKQYGGGMLVANTPNELYTGLNDTNYNHAVLNLVGNNTIRGLDSGRPVAVTDGSKYRVLYGKHDTDTFKNKVYESRL